MPKTNIFYMNYKELGEKNPCQQNEFNLHKIRLSLKFVTDKLVF